MKSAVVGVAGIIACALLIAHIEHRYAPTAPTGSVMKQQDIQPTARFQRPIDTTWVMQAGNDGYGNQITNPRRRYTKAGDLTERSK